MAGTNYSSLVRPTYYADTIAGPGLALSSVVDPVTGQPVTLGSACYVNSGDGAGNPAVWTCEPSTVAVDHVNVEAVSGLSQCRWIRAGAFGGGSGTVASSVSLTSANFALRDIEFDNTYSWEIETNTTPGGGTNYFGGNAYNFGNGGCLRITAGGAGNQAFARVTGSGLGSDTPPGKFCEFLNPQALPMYLRVRFALSSDTGSFNGIVWLVRVGSVLAGPSTALSNFGVAWNGNRQILEVRSESPLGNTQEYQIPMTFDHAQHVVEVFADGAQMSVRMDNSAVSITDVSTVGVTGAGATGTALPLPIEMPVMPSFIDWGVNNIGDSNTNVGACWYGPLTYGWMDRPKIGSVR